MNKYLCIATLVFLASCGQTNNKLDRNEAVNTDSLSNLNKDGATYKEWESKVNTDSLSNLNESASLKNYTLTDKTITFFSRDIINDEFCKTITDPERAALGYVATFIGNHCSWDGDYTDDRSNLKCIILTALNLGYQCSDRHLGFLRQMFKNDNKVLEELKSDNCPTIPDGATIQTAFDEITLTVKGNKIIVFFKAGGINTREGYSWSWTETDHFQLDKDNIKLIKKDKSKVEVEKFDTGE